MNECWVEYTMNDESFMWKKRCVRCGKMNAQFENEWMNEWMLNKCCENRLEMYQN